MSFAKLIGVVASGLLVGMTGCHHSASTVTRPVYTPGVQVAPYGKTQDGKAVEAYTLTNARGTVAKIITYGATLTELHVADKKGNPGDVVLGFDQLDQYETRSPYFGSTVGRYANRIAGGKFTLDGKEFKLFVNNGPNSLHGGKKGFDKVVWRAEKTASPGGPAVRFSHLSPDGDEGYPGNLNVTVIYTLSDRDELKIEYSAVTDAPTPLNLTNHTYWNLSAEKSPTILDEVLTVNADRYTPFDDVQIPTGKIQSVKGTALDFLKATPIGARISQASGGPPVGYDHNYVLNKWGSELTRAARVRDPGSGRVMEVFTTEPGMQFYTGNFLDGKVMGKDGVAYPQYGAFCLETQHYPDSPNHPNFPSTILRPGEAYHQVTIYRFSTE